MVPCGRVHDAGLFSLSRVDLHTWRSNAMRKTLSCLAAVVFALVPLSLKADDDVRHRIKHVFVIVLENGL